MNRIGKKSIQAVIGVLMISVLGNWGAQGSRDERPKPAVNFEGTLKAVQGQELKVENISLHGRIRQIPMYDAPKVAGTPKLNEKTGLKEIMLAKNPRESLVITKIDLQEVLEIHVNPEPIWIYQESDKHRRIVFVKIDIISNDGEKTKNSYLIEEATKLFCDQINDAGPLEKEVPITAVDRLVIVGHEDNKDIDDQEEEKSEISPAKCNCATSIKVQESASSAAPSVVAPIGSVTDSKPVEVTVKVESTPVASVAPKTSVATVKDEKEVIEKENIGKKMDEEVGEKDETKEIADVTEKNKMADSQQSQNKQVSSVGTAVSKATGMATTGPMPAPMPGVMVVAPATTSSKSSATSTAGTLPPTAQTMKQ